MKKKALIIGGAATILVLTILGVAIYGLSLLSKWVLLTWAILATLALPICIWAAWTLGRYESAALLRGIDTGVGRVAQAAVRLKSSGPTNIAVLPPMIHRRLPEAERIDL